MLKGMGMVLAAVDGGGRWWKLEGEVGGGRLEVVVTSIESG